MVKYFNYEWLEFLNGWFEDYSNVPFTPSTNNNLESTNRYIKDKNTLRNRLWLQEFLKTAFEIVKNWSLDRDGHENPEVKLFFKEPIIDLKLQTSAYQWIKTDKTILTYEN